jgi:hypothetical protein
MTLPALTDETARRIEVEIEVTRIVKTWRAKEDGKWQDPHTVASKYRGTSDTDKSAQIYAANGLAAQTPDGGMPSRYLVRACA